MKNKLKFEFNARTFFICILLLASLILVCIGLFGSFLKDSTTAINLSTITDLMEQDEDNDYNHQWFNLTVIFAWLTFSFCFLCVIVTLGCTFFRVKSRNYIVAFVALFTFIFSFLVVLFTFKMAQDIPASFAFGPVLLFFGGLLCSISCFMFEKDFPKDKLVILFGAIIFFGLILSAIGLSSNYLKVTDLTDETERVSLPQLDALNKYIELKHLQVSNVFAWVVFSLTIVCVFTFFAPAFLKSKKTAFFSTLLGLSTIICSILVLVLAVKMASDSSVTDNKYLSYSFSLSAGPILLWIGGLLCGIGTVILPNLRLSTNVITPAISEKKDQTLQKMKDLVDAGILSEEQFEQKKKELDEREKKALVADKADEILKKMSELVEAGILSQDDYDLKAKEIDEQKNKHNEERLTIDEMIANLKKMNELVSFGVLSQEEFESKKAELNPLSKLRQLVDNGIITQEEYEAKKAEIAKIYN